MPDNTYPPFGGNAGAFTVPRQLNRWLDVNPQGGALRRCQTTITLPAFTAADEWNGYSDIVTSFNFEAPNNFSLTYPFSVPTSPNYVLCVSYRVGTVVARYLLWDATGSNLNQDITPYTGQPLPKNIRLEVWNTSHGASSQATDIVFMTSKLQNVDYRYGSDAALVGNDGQITAFEDSVMTSGVSNPLGTFDPIYYPITFVKTTDTTGFISGLDGSVIDGTMWQNEDGTLYVNEFSKGTVTPTITPTMLILALKGIASGTLVCGHFDGANMTPVIWRLTAVTTTVTTVHLQRIDGVGGANITTVVAADYDDIMVTATFTTPASTQISLNVYDSAGNLLNGTLGNDGSKTSFEDYVGSAFSIGVQNTSSFYGGGCSETCRDPDSVAKYLSQTLYGYSLPLTFPTTSVSVTN